jgi:hypothetical protein
VIYTEYDDYEEDYIVTITEEGEDGVAMAVEGGGPFSADEFVYGFVELLDGLNVVPLDSVNDAGRHVLLEDHPADGFNG